VWFVREMGASLGRSGLRRLPRPNYSSAEAVKRWRHVRRTCHFASHEDGPQENGVRIISGRRFLVFCSLTVAKFKCQAALPLAFNASSARRPVSSAIWSKLAR
jgi:hypothetical protein